VARTDAENPDCVAVFHRDFELLPRENLDQPLAKGGHQSLHLILIA
jgi:hypothetical protein